MSQQKLTDALAKYKRILLDSAAFDLVERCTGMPPHPAQVLAIRVALQKARDEVVSVSRNCSGEQFTKALMAAEFAHATVQYRNLKES